MAHSSNLIETQSTMCSIYQEPYRAKESHNPNHTMQPSKNRFIITEEPMPDYIPSAEQKILPAVEYLGSKPDIPLKNRPKKFIEKNNTSLSMTYSSVSSAKEKNAQSVSHNNNKEDTLFKKTNKLITKPAHISDAGRKHRLVEIEKIKQQHYEEVSY